MKTPINFFPYNLCSRKVWFSESQNIKRSMKPLLNFPFVSRSTCFPSLSPTRSLSFFSSRPLKQIRNNLNLSKGNSSNYYYYFFLSETQIKRLCIAFINLLKNCYFVLFFQTEWMPFKTVAASIQLEVIKCEQLI